jgi:hypothetical protein
MKRHLEVFKLFQKSSKLDVDRLLNTCLNDDLYTTLGNIAVLPDYLNEAGEKRTLQRDLAKVEVFRMLFTKSGFKSKYIPIENVFEGFYETLDELKKIFEVSFDDDKNHFNIFLQLVESFIFVEKVYPYLIQLGVPCFTKHDSVLVPRNLEDSLRNSTDYYPLIAEAAMNKVFDEIGFKGKLKVDDYRSVDTESFRFGNWDLLLEILGDNIFDNLT